MKYENAVIEVCNTLVVECEDEPLDDDCAMDSATFEKLKDYVQESAKKIGTSRLRLKLLLGHIYDLFQDYQISEKQETELYDIADKGETFNEVAEYWLGDYDFDRKGESNPLSEFVRRERGEI